jgi:hypothetical protein
MWYVGMVTARKIPKASLVLFKKQVSLLYEGQIKNAERNFVRENEAKLPFNAPKQTDRKQNKLSLNTSRSLMINLSPCLAN